MNVTLPMTYPYILKFANAVSFLFLFSPGRSNPTRHNETDFSQTTGERF